MTRSTFLNRLIGIAGLGFFGLGDIQKLQKIYMQQCFVAGFRFHRGMELLPLLQEGDLLELRREPDNEHDAFAIALYWQQEMIGYLPKACNELLARLMDAKALSLLAGITHLDRSVKPWENVAIAVYFLQPEQVLPPHAAYLTQVVKPGYRTRKTPPLTPPRVGRGTTAPKMTAPNEDEKQTEPYPGYDDDFPAGVQLEGGRLPHVLDEFDRVIDLNGIEDETARSWFEQHYGHRRLDIPGGDYVLVPDNGIYTHMYNVDSVGWVQDNGGKRWLEFGWWKE